MLPVVIIGGGISGLSAAYYLSRAGIPSTLIERRPYLGGVIRTDQFHGCVLEAGPDSFLAAKPWALDLIRELNLSGELIGSNDHLRVTYIRKGGKLMPLPDGLMMMVPTRILPMVATRLLDWPTKIRMGLELLRRPGQPHTEDRSVADFIRDHYGDEAVDYLAEPLLAGVYGGDPEQLSVTSVLTRFVELEEKYGSLSRGILNERKQRKRTNSAAPLFQTLKSGLGKLTGTLVEATGRAVTVIESEALAIERRAGGGYRIALPDGSLEAGQVVLACQAYEAGDLVRLLDAQLADLLTGISYSSSATVSLGYDAQTFGQRLKGFGFLIPKRERRRVVAGTWVGNKFSHRVPDDKVLMRCFLSGDQSIFQEDDQALVDSVREEIRDIAGVHAEPMFWRVARWPRSMAQYTVGHEKRIETVEGRLQSWPGLLLAGNAYHGVGIPDCIRAGKQAAESIASFR
ncbi:MAG: protoporphyrinogen oxidase [Bryobacteraceae bacterium]